MNELNYGTMSDSISSQLRKQKMSFDKERVKHFQKMADALTMLKVKGILTDKECVNARNKLHTIILRHIKENNKK